MHAMRDYSSAIQLAIRRPVERTAPSTNALTRGPSAARLHSCADVENTV